MFEAMLYQSCAQTASIRFCIGLEGTLQPAVRTISPSLVNQDFSLGKSTKFNEKRSLEFRAEFFNIFNSAHLGNPATTLGNKDFGTISSTVGTPREVQLGLKFQF